MFARYIFSFSKALAPSLKSRMIRRRPPPPPPPQYVSSNGLYSDVIGCSRYLKSQLARYIFKTRKLERALKIKDVLCSSLAEKLDVMREEKTSRTTDYASRNMNNNRVSGNNCSQLEECNGYSCGANEPDSTREQIRSAQHEGNKEKMDKAAVSGSVICSNEGHVQKTKLENVEKEFNHMKDELNKVCTEKSQVKKEKNSTQDWPCYELTFLCSTPVRVRPFQ